MSCRPKFDRTSRRLAGVKKMSTPGRPHWVIDPPGGSIVAKITIQDLKKIKEQQRTKMVLREGEFRAKITVHMGTCGIAAGARDIMTTFRQVMVPQGYLRTSS